MFQYKPYAIPSAEVQRVLRKQVEWQCMTMFYQTKQTWNIAEHCVEAASSNGLTEV